MCGRARGRAGGTATKAATTSGKAKTCLIPHFILPRAKPPARPHAPVLEPGQRHVQRGVAEIGVNLRNPDHLMLARAFGCEAVRPSSLDGLKSAVSGAAKAKGPTFIEVRQDAPFLA